MRSLIRLIVAHVLASFTLQAFLLAWMTITGEHFSLIRAAIAMALSPILIPVVLLGLGHKMRPVGRIVFWLLYLVMLTGAFLLLRLREHRRRLPAHRTSRGLCVACRYDLRGSQQECPECGAVFT